MGGGEDGATQQETAQLWEELLSSVVEKVFAAPEDSLSLRLLRSFLSPEARRPTSALRAVVGCCVDRMCAAPPVSAQLFYSTDVVRDLSLPARYRALRKATVRPPTAYFDLGHS